jgi:hypothetical protein
MMIINDDSRVVNLFEASLTDDARVVINDRHMFIVQAIGKLKLQEKSLHSQCSLIYSFLPIYQIL